MDEQHDTALLFPGQGSQVEDMREMVESVRPDLVELAAEAVGEDPFARVGQSTRFDQPAIFCAGLAGFERLGRATPGCFAGHSLGELTALTAAGALSERDGLALVAERGRLMALAGEGGESGGMLVLRADRDAATAIADRAGLALANDNAPRQVVLSGPEAALDAGMRAAQDDGVGAKRLPVAGAFHSPAMEPAVEPFRAALSEADFGAPDAPVYSCVTCEPFDDPPLRLAQALVNPVRWREVLAALHAAGVRRYVEAGPGAALSGMVRRSLDGVEVETVDALESARA